MTKFKISVFIGALGVIFGAFGAHTMKSLLSVDQLASWKTGVFYLFIHVIMMVILSLSEYKRDNKKVIDLSWKLFAIGILLFSGSIFILSSKDLLPFNTRWLGPITPIGGLLFILGWLNLLRLKTNIEDH